MLTRATRAELIDKINNTHTPGEELMAIVREYNTIENNDLTETTPIGYMALDMYNRRFGTADTRGFDDDSWLEDFEIDGEDATYLLNNWEGEARARVENPDVYEDYENFEIIPVSPYVPQARRTKEALYKKEITA